MRQRTDRPTRHVALIATVSLLGWISMMLGGCTTFLGPHEKRASAQLLPMEGNTAHGLVTFIERTDGVQVTYNLSGLSANSDHALQVHERSSCIAAQSSNVGPIFSVMAGRLRADARAEGDLGNIHADTNGVATGFMVAPDISLDGVRSVINRSILVHQDASDADTSVEPNAGPALACGLIKIKR